MWWNSVWGNLLLTFLVAMVPIVELRGAIPFGVARDLDLWAAIAAAVLGNLLPVPFIILFIRNIFAWLRKRHSRLNDLVNRLEARAEGKENNFRCFSQKQAVIFVRIPKNKRAS